MKEIDMARIGTREVLPFLVVVALTAGCGGSPKPVATPAVTITSLTAQRIVDRLGDLYPLPNPRDNTSFCARAGCRQLITTDTVSVYEFGDDAAAQRWVAGFPGSQHVGRFVLSYSGERQKLTSEQARAEMLAEVKRLAGP